MTHRTITIPRVTAALLAHGITNYSTHDYRGSVEVGDRGIIVAGRGPVRSEDVPEGWFYDDEFQVTPRLWRPHRHGGYGEVYPVHFRAAVAVGTVAEVVPIVDEFDMTAAAPYVRPILSGEMRPMLIHRITDALDTSEVARLSHLLPYSDWSPTTASGKQRWAVRWEGMRVLDEAVTEYRCLSLECDIYCECGAEGRLPVPLHRGWREADAGLIEACGEVSDGA